MFSLDFDAPFFLLGPELSTDLIHQHYLFFCTDSPCSTYLFTFQLNSFLHIKYTQAVIYLPPVFTLILSGGAEGVTIAVWVKSTGCPEKIIALKDGQIYLLVRCGSNERSVSLILVAHKCISE